MALKLNYKQYSDTGPPLLVMHGVFGSQANWGWHSKQLSEHYAVYGVDLRNHGDSPHDPQLSYVLMAEDVRRLLQDLDIPSCYLLGHSMGGKVAMQLALSHPELIERLIVVDIAPVTYRGGGEEHAKIIASMKGLNLDSLQSRKEAEDKLSRHIEDPDTLQFILTNLERNPAGGYRWRLNLDAIEENYDLLRVGPQADGPFDKPTLFIKGELSNYIREKNEAEIKRLFPRASIETVKDAGHWVHAEKPQEVQRLITAFLPSGYEGNQP